MTKKLEDILNLPNVKQAFKEVDKKEQARANKNQTKEVMKNVDPQTRKNLQKSYEEFDKVAAALPQVKGLGELSDLCCFLGMLNLLQVRFFIVLYLAC